MFRFLRSPKRLFKSPYVYRRLLRGAKRMQAQQQQSKRIVYNERSQAAHARVRNKL